MRIPAHEWHAYSLTYRVHPHPQALEMQLHERDLVMQAVMKGVREEEVRYGRMQEWVACTWPRMYLVRNHQ